MSPSLAPGFWVSGPFEQFEVVFVGGPHPGACLTAPGGASWPLPGTVPRGGGAYLRVREAGGPSRTGLLRGAVYQWYPA